MKTFKFYKFFLIILLGSSQMQSVAQVWPGDISDNGVVNNFDFLYWGFAYGEAGPARPGDQLGIDFEQKTITEFWGADFPGTDHDFVFADCDGNGEVDIIDKFAIQVNYGLTNDNVIPENTIVGIEGIDPKIRFVQNVDFDHFPQGSELPFIIELGSSDIAVQEFYGIAFTIRYDPDIITDNLFFLLINNTWNDLPDDFSFFNNNSDEGLLEVATSRFAMDAVDNTFGILANLSFVIEDNVVGIMEPDVTTTFYIENIKMVNGDFETIPVAGDSIDVTITNGTVSTNSPEDGVHLEAFPNPADDQLFLRASHAMESLELYNAFGQQLIVADFDPVKNYTLSVSAFPNGIYFVKTKTDKGLATQKIIIR